MKKIVVTLSVDENVILGEAGQEHLEDAITQELGWLHDSGMFVDGWQYAEPEKENGNQAFVVEMEMVKLLTACLALSEEHDMSVAFGEALSSLVFAPDPHSSSKILDFLLQNLEDFEKAMTINKALILTADITVKDLLDVLSIRAIDCLHDDLVNVIDESEMDGLSSARQGYLDNRYLEITTTRGRLVELINAPGFSHDLSFGDKLKCANERAGISTFHEKEPASKAVRDFEY